ncbi:MAG: DUF5060 domain-containing protein [Aureliella sp.]
MKSPLLGAFCGLLFLYIVPTAISQEPSFTTRIRGDLKQWHKVTVELDGPQADESDVSPNPFLDYEFTVEFQHESGTPLYRVPGYFAADGDAGETSATSGRVWKAHLSPDKAGTWNYLVSFKSGEQVAVGSAGSPLKPFDGIRGQFEIQANDKTAPDLRAAGRLQYVGERYLRFAGSGEYFLKAGADAPETLLAYRDFDGTVTFKEKKAPLKSWEPHRRDWQPGDPTWKSGKGKGLIGAINYLASEGMNAFSFLTYNAGGDGDNVWPFVKRDSKFHYDCSKLDQWGVIFDHATTKGMYLHFKLSESENSGFRKKDNVAFDRGDTGPERKLYLRELVARYGYLLALNWNLGEENTQTVAQQSAMADYLSTIDPYHHLIVTHTGGRWTAHEKVYPKLIGDQSVLTGASIQTRTIMDTHRFVLHWIRESNQAGRPWVVANDEQDEGSTGTPPDKGFEGYEQTKGPHQHEIRKYALWGTLMAGGAGIEYYFGYLHPEDDLVCENWRSRDRTWDYARHALAIFRTEKIPYWAMENANELVGNLETDNSRYCLAKRNSVYLVYLPTGGSSALDLSHCQGEFSVAWFDPRNGGALQQGSIEKVAGGSEIDLGLPPSELNKDWLVLIRKD